MDRLSQYNLAGNFIHIGNGEYVPARNIKMVEPLTDEDKAQLAERVPNARRNFQFRVKFWDKTQKLVEELDAAPGTFVRVDENAIIPIANVQGLKQLSDQDRTRLRERHHNAQREFQTRVEGSGYGHSFLSTWSVAQITGTGEETDLNEAPQPQTRGRSKSKTQARPQPAG